VPPAGVVVGAAVGPWLGVGVPHALETIASAASSPIARRLGTLMTQSLLGLLRVLGAPPAWTTKPSQSNSVTRT
jgi:hypothetical protein